MIPVIPTRSELDLSLLTRYVRQKLLPSARDRDRSGEFPLDVFKELHSQGWLNSFIPKGEGGMGVTATDLACMTREIAYASAGIATSFIGNVLGMSPIVLYADPELKRKLCKDYLTRFSLWSFCMTEPDTGTDIHNTKTLARQAKNGYELTGKKCFITNAGFAEHLLVFARTDGEVDPKSPLTAFYVPANTPGVSRGKNLDKLGQRDSNTAEIFFDQVRIPAEYRIGKEGEGLKVAFHSLHRTKTMFASAAVGTCDRAIELGSEHLSNRALYGKPLLSIPTIRTFLAQLHTEVQAAWLLACLAAATWDSGDFAIKEASMAKLFGGHTAVKVTGEVLELFGGYGYSRELELERLYRDAKLFEIIEGASFVQQILISKEIFRQYKENGVIKKAA